MSATNQATGTGQLRHVGGDPLCDGDYPEDVLVKVASAKLESKDAKVFSFIQNFTLTTDDQLGLLPAVEIDKRAAAEVAAEWIANNETIWSACFK